MLMKLLHSKSICSWLLAAAALAVLTSVAAGVWRGVRDAARGEDAGWPPLPETQASCPEPREHARHAARAALGAARARMQRYAFAPRDGRLALERLAEAVECARAANDGELASEAARELAGARARIESDGRDHLRRYQHLKERDRLDEAASDIAFLLELGWPESGALARRLRRDGDVAAGNAAEARP